MNVSEIIARLEEKQSPENRAGMARFGINVEKAFGISVAELRKMARVIGKDQGLAEELWSTGIHEARILAVLVADPKRIDRELMESWAGDFDSWDVVDLTMIHLFRKHSAAHQLAIYWAGCEEEYVKRAGFSLMATLAVHDKKAGNDLFEGYLALVEEASDDSRNYVKKAVNWALRQIGKRNSYLNCRAVEASQRIASRGSRSARWIASDALRELTGDKVREKLAGAGKPW